MLPVYRCVRVQGETTVEGLLRALGERVVAGWWRGRAGWGGVQGVADQGRMQWASALGVMGRGPVRVR